MRETRSTYYGPGSGGAYSGRSHRHWHHGPPFPFFIFFVFFGLTHMALFMGVILLATLTAALVVTAVVLATQVAVPALRGWSSQTVRTMSGRRRDRLHTRYSSADLRLPGPALGPDAYRQRLLEVLKERYVRGEIALAEFEERATQIVRDPSVKHLA